MGGIRSRQHDVRTLPVRRVVGFENQPGLALDRGLVLRVVDNGRRLIERGNFSLQETRETVDEPGRGADCTDVNVNRRILVAAIATRT